MVPRKTLSRTTSGHDCIQPTHEELEITLHKSREYWHALAQRSLAQYNHGLPSQCIKPQNMLKRIPAIPDSHCHEALEIVSSNGVLYMKAESAWSVAEGDDCRISRKQKIRPAFLSVGVRKPTPVCFRNDLFHWGIGAEKKPRQTNVIGILALGWSYIFSAELIKRQGRETSSLIYTNSTAGIYDCAEENINNVIDIGYAGEQAARWWASLLAPGQGWKAIVAQDDNNSYVSPWSVVLDCDERFKIRWRGSLSSPMTMASAPSSQQALEFLIEFCTLHDSHSQLFASLTIAMTFPTHNYYGTLSTLPSFGGLNILESLKDTANTTQLYDEIPYYMTMSCHHNVLVSSLCGVFWEPKISCNTVSPWLHPVLKEIPETICCTGSPSYDEVLTLMCAMRCPNLAALWLGATLSGLSTTIIDFVRSGTPPLDPNASAWTGCPQSFMDTPGSGPYILPNSLDSRISRADAWRLLYLPPIVDDDLHYNSPPFSPWQPVGTTNFQSAAIRVQVHKDCPRHELIYRHWSWCQRNDTALVDHGYCSDILPIYPHITNSIAPAKDHPILPMSDQEASITASREVFAWVTRNCEGNPPEEIYLDAWIRDDSDSEKLESISSSDSLGSQNTKDHSTNQSISPPSIQGWIAQLT